MKRAINSFNTASRLSPGVVTMIFSYLVLPLLILAGFGAAFIFQKGYVVYFVGLLAGLSLLSVVLQKMKKDSASSVADDFSSEESFVEPSNDWGKHDHEVWEQINRLIPEQLKERSDWGYLKDHALEIASQTSKAYGRKELDFSVPELLKMTEEISRRYRKVLLTHVPFIESISCSLYKSGYDHQEKIETGLNVGSLIYKAYRVVRIITPTGVISELMGQIQSKIFGAVNDHLQYRLKQAFLQDVLSVAIDLYSGRFKVDDENLHSSQAAIEDTQRMAAPLDPLRVCLMGQVSSGKSSIVNALKKEVAAETNKLPSTDRASVYQCSVEGIDMLHLVDLPGFDGDPKTEQQLLEQATKSHVILWVLKANQSARRLDSEFKAKLDTFYSDPKNRSKKPPVIIGVLNQVDRLKPVSEWQPPYDLESSQTPKARIIRDALGYNRELLDIPTMVPLSVSEDREHFNLSELEHLLDQYFGEGIQVQLNQRRNEAGEGFDLSGQFKRVYQSGKLLF